MKEQLKKFQNLTSRDSTFLPTLQALMGDLRQHVYDEETCDLPKLEAALSEKESMELSRSFARTNGVLGEGLPWSRHFLGYLLPEQGIQQWTDVLRHLLNCTSFTLVRDGWSDKNRFLDHLTPTDAITVMLKAITEADIPVQEFWWTSNRQTDKGTVS